MVSNTISHSSLLKNGKVPLTFYMYAKELHLLSLYELPCSQEKTYCGRMGRGIRGERERETCREKDETRKDDDDERSMEKNRRGAVQEEEAGVVSPDSTNKNSSHL